MLLWLVSPIPLLVFFNAKRAIAGRGLEPFSDNMTGYLLLLLIFSASAISTGMYHARGVGRRKFISYGLAGAFGSTALMTTADMIDSYFSGPGVGWIWPLTGFALGFVFGGVFRTMQDLQLRWRS